LALMAPHPTTTAVSIERPPRGGGAFVAGAT